MDESRTQNKNEQQDEQEQRAPELDGQLTFDGANICEVKQENEQPRSLHLYIKENGLKIVDQDGKDIKDDPQALEEYKRIAKQIEVSVLHAATDGKSTEEITDYYRVLNYQNGGKYKSLAIDLLNMLPEATAEEVKTAAERIQQKATKTGIEAGKIISRAESVKSYLIKELQKDIYNGETISTLMYNRPAEALADPDDDRTKLLLKAIAAAEKTKVEAATTTAKRAQKIIYPLDNINNEVWDVKADKIKERVTFNGLNGNKAPFYYAINFDDLADDVKITKKLQPFDKSVYIAVFALYNAGNDVISTTQIYYAMGNTDTTPAPYQIEKINNSLTKMSGAKIYIDNENEAEALPGRNSFTYDSQLLPFERKSAYINGKLTESAIHLFREPPLMSFAKSRNQITTLNAKLLQSPLSQTDANLLLRDYLLERISREKRSRKNKEKNFRILLDTLYERAGINKPNQRKQRERAITKVKTYLDFYKKQRFIKRYTIQADGITIYY